MKAIDINAALESENKDRGKRAAKSLFFTLFIVFDILALLYIFKIKNLDPPIPEFEGGVLVAMGDPDAGNSDDSPPMASEQPASSSSSAEENLITGETDEDAPTVKSNPDVKPQPTDPNAAPQIDKPIENKTPTVDPSTLFKKGKTGDGTGKGDGGKDGNQGQPDGTGDDPLGRGIGDGSGDGYYMGEGKGKRKPVTKITASCNFNRNEKVVVKIKIDKEGNVKESKCVLNYKTLSGTANSGSYCDCALAAAKNVKFSPKADAPATQEGAILFDFKVK